MANEEFWFFADHDRNICTSKIHFEPWEHNSPAAWTETTHFDTAEECCASAFSWDYDGCVQRSPVKYEFEFCFDVQGLIDPYDCHSADIFAMVFEDAINEATHVAHNLAGTHSAEKTPADAQINKIGDVSLSKGDNGATDCGGSLAGQDYTNSYTGITGVNLDYAANKISNVCGRMTIEDEVCKTKACLQNNYEAIKQNLGQYVNSGDMTLTIRRRAAMRIPAVPELQPVSALQFSFTAQNLKLPNTVTRN